MKQQFGEQQIIAVLQEPGPGGHHAPTKAEVRRTHGISDWTYYRWRQQYQGLAVSQVRRL
jgi:transposase-like protein